MSRRPLWELLFQRFDPEQPAELPEWRALRPLSPAEAIGKALDRPFGIPRVLLTGTVGTGKTTELLRIAQARAPKEFVVFLNLERHFHEVVGDPAALQQVSPWEVCFLAGLSLLRSAEERLGFAFPEGHLRDLGKAWAALAKASGEVEKEPELDVAKLAKSMVLLASNTAKTAGGPVGAAVGTGLSALASVADAGKWSLPFGLEKRALPDQDSQVQTLLRSVNVLIGLVQQRASKVLLIIDGLDRIEDFDRAKALLLDSQLIGQLACRTVVCGPFALRRDGAIVNVRGFSDVPPLVNVPVLSQADPARPGPGVSFLCDLYARRVADLGAEGLVPQPLLERLAYYSGGRAREFVVFVRRLAEFAWDEGADVATAALVDRVLDERRRRRETGLHRGHIRLLEAVAADPDHRLPEDELAYKLLTYGALLPYPDGSEWYYPHPLLTLNLVRAKPTGSSR
ncbi:hypothetical protein [Sorangium sp. So ce1389]|uniref:hypothetical protein n=1 Tax=Sorangium sp. So ce1389 TaxID=3133336 RepID=UPI003F63403E